MSLIAMVSALLVVPGVVRCQKCSLTVFRPRVHSVADQNPLRHHLRLRHRLFRLLHLPQFLQVLR